MSSTYKAVLHSPCFDLLSSFSTSLARDVDWIPRDSLAEVDVCAILATSVPYPTNTQTYITSLLSVPLGSQLENT